MTKADSPVDLGVPNNLVAQLSSFVGRVEDLDRVAGLLGRSRHVTLTGAGGCGKTRLAREAATRAAPGFPQGVWWVELVALAPGDQLAPLADELARVLKLPVEGDPAVDAVVEYLAEATALVVLDNCEHVVDAAAAFADRLLRGSGGVQVLATSRQPLAVEGEVAWRVPSMDVPPVDVEVAALARFDASRLFCERVQQVRPELSFTAESAAAVAAICGRLDGIPLALELAAARAGGLTLPRIAAELGDRFRLLAGGPRTARHRTLLASVEWSVGLLDDGERTLLARLAVFVGGFTADAAIAVAGFAPLASETVLDVLTRLVDRSLVQLDDVGGAGRYRLLETIRAFASEQVRAAGQATVLADRHLDWVLALAAGHDDAMARAELAALDLVELELPNVRAALDHATVSPTGGPAGLRLAAALTFFWSQRGLGLEGAQRAVQLLEAHPDAPQDLRGRAWAATGYDRFYGGDFEAAAADAKAGLVEATAAGDVLGQGRCHHVLGEVAFVVDPPTCRTEMSEAIRLAEQAGDYWCETDALQFHAFSHLIQHRTGPAQEGMARSGAMADAVGNAFQQACHQLGLGMAAAAAGRLREAADHARAGGDGARRIGDPVIEMWGRAAQITMALSAGRFAELTEIADETGQPGRPQYPVTEAYVAQARRVARAWQEPGPALDALFALAALLRTTFVPNEGLRLGLIAAAGALALGDVQRAQAAAQASYDDVTAYGSALVGPAQVLLGRLHRRAGEVAAAERATHEGLTVILDAGLVIDVPDALEALAGIAVDTDSAGEAARLLGCASRLRADMGQPGAYPTDAPADRARAAAALGGEFDRCWNEGAQLSVEEAAAYARRARGARKRPSFGWDSLTPTEREVVRLAATGLTNREIGEKLFVSLATVKTHLEHVYAKLAVRGRAELAAVATRHGGI